MKGLKGILSVAGASMLMASGLVAENYENGCNGYYAEDSGFCFGAALEPFMVRTCHKNVPTLFPESFDAEWDWGIRADLNMADPCGVWDVTLRYTGFSTDKSVSDSIPVITYPPFPGSPPPTYVKLKSMGSSTLEEDFHIVDAIVSYSCCNLCDMLEVRPYAGFRYFHYESDYVVNQNQTTTENTGAFTKTKVSAEGDYSSPGFLWGLELRSCKKSFCNWEMGLNGRIGMFYLSGGSYERTLGTGYETGSSGAVVPKDSPQPSSSFTKFSESSCKAFGGFEGAIGLEFARCYCGHLFTLGLGYEISIWGRDFTNLNQAAFLNPSYQETPQQINPSYPGFSSGNSLNVGMFLFRLGYGF